MKEFLIKNKYVLTIALFIVLNIFVSYFYIGYSPELKKDAGEYYEAAKFLEHHPIDGHMQLGRVLTTPLFLYTSIAVDYFVNDFSKSFAIVNILFYFFCIFAFYFLCLEIYKEKKVALLSTVLVAFNFYVIDPSNSHLADMGGWFFFTLATLFAVKYIKTNSKKSYYLAVLFTTIGVLFKEYGGLALANLSLLILISDLPLKTKLKDIFIAAVIVIIPLLSFHVLIYLKYHYLYTDRYLFVNQSAVHEAPKNLSLLIKIIGWLFSFGWIAFCYGVWMEYKNKDLKRIKILLAILPVTLTFYFWPAITQRLGVMFMMWLALLAGYGLSQVRWYALYPFLVLYIWFNYNIESLIAKINLPF